MKSVITTIVISILFTFTVFANNDNGELGNGEMQLTPAETSTDNCFFLDLEEKILFIDLEEINGFAKEIVIKNGNDEIIFAEQMWDQFDLNGNIYEWSYAEENASNITIELYTFTKVLTKEIQTLSPMASK